MLTDPSVESRVASLDGFRAVSIGLVLCAHSVIYRTGSSPAHNIATACGSVGVTLFFVLSGFLITRLLIKELQTTGGISLRGFYLRRALRILPAYSVFVLTLLVLVSIGVLPKIVSRDAMISLLFARNLVGRTHETAHLWSLSLEEQFYALWPLAFLLFVRRSPVLMTGVAIAGLLVWRQVRWCMGEIPISVLYLRTDMRFDSILFGCLLAAMSDWLKKAQSWPAWATLLIVLGATISAVAIACVVTPHTILHAYVHTIVAALGSIALAGLLMNPTAWVAQLFALRPIAWVGRLSYSLYLWQQLFLGPTESGLVAMRSVPWLGLILTAVAATISYYLIELPFLKIKSRYSRSTKSQAEIELNRNRRPLIDR